MLFDSRRTVLRCRFVVVRLVRKLSLDERQIRHLGKSSRSNVSEQCQQRTATGISTEIRLIGHRPFGNSQRTSTPASLFHEAYVVGRQQLMYAWLIFHQPPYLAVASTRVLQIDLNASPSRKTTVSKSWLYVKAKGGVRG